jgi:hypothetical protein
MRYWAYFAAKLLVAGTVFYGLLALLGPLAPDDPTPRTPYSKSVSVINPNSAPASGQQKALTDRQAKLAKLRPLDHAGASLAINLALMVWFVLAVVTLYLIVRDQRYRCRVCVRRLRMPVESGSRSFMLQLGRPRVEYICPYGHGTLKQEEYGTSALENPEWTESSGDMWEELYAASRDSGDRDSR